MSRKLPTLILLVVVGALVGWLYGTVTGHQTPFLIGVGAVAGLVFGLVSVAPRGL